jgi:hypothetical protein
MPGLPQPSEAGLPCLRSNTYDSDLNFTWSPGQCARLYGSSRCEPVMVAEIVLDKSPRGRGLGLPDLHARIH